MTDSTYVPRLSVEIRPDQEQAMARIFPHGTRKIFFQALIDGVIAIHSKYGFEGLAPIMSGHVDMINLARLGQPYTHAQYKGEDE